MQSTRSIDPFEVIRGCAVRLECLLADGSQSTGTGFIFHFDQPNKPATMGIVTNKHVVTNAVEATFSLNTGSGINAPTGHRSVTVPDFAGKWVGHPDATLDLCVIPTDPILCQLCKSGNFPESGFSLHCLNRSFIPTDEQWSQLLSLEEVFLVGYPNGIWDSLHNRPINRRGITASDPKLPFKGAEEFLIDASIFPGSSGSPVVLYNLGPYHDNTGRRLNGIRVKLLGVVRAVYQHDCEGILDIAKICTQTPVPNNLGVVIKSKYLLDFERLNLTKPC